MVSGKDGGHTSPCPSLVFPEASSAKIVPLPHRPFLSEIQFQALTGFWHLFHLLPPFFGHQSPEVSRAEAMTLGSSLKINCQSPAFQVSFGDREEGNDRRAVCVLTNGPHAPPGLPHPRQTSRLMAALWVSGDNPDWVKLPGPPTGAAKASRDAVRGHGLSGLSEPGGEATVVSEWPHPLAMEGGGLLTFLFPMSESLFAGALERAAEASSSQSGYWSVALLNTLDSVVLFPV